MAAYSETPLTQKLGIKADFHLLIINEPANFRDLLLDLPKDITWENKDATELDYLHLFATSQEQYQDLLLTYMSSIKKDGMIWVSWPKSAAKLNTDLNENAVRNFALDLGLVDIKVCSIDDIWSGLKLVWRVKNR